jgi:uncharacterized membrane protein
MTGTKATLLDERARFSFTQSAASAPGAHPWPSISPWNARIPAQSSRIRYLSALLDRHFEHPSPRSLKPGPDPGNFRSGLLHSADMKWALVIVLAIIGVLAAIAAIEYFVVPIHSLPSFMGARHTAGHYRKRGAVAALIAVVALVAAGVLAVRFRREDTASTQTSASTADQLLARPQATPEGPSN